MHWVHEPASAAADAVINLVRGPLSQRVLCMVPQDHTCTAHFPQCASRCLMRAVPVQAVQQHLQVPAVGRAVHHQGQGPLLRGPKGRGGARRPGHPGRPGHVAATPEAGAALGTVSAGVHAHGCDWRTPSTVGLRHLAPSSQGPYIACVLAMCSRIAVLHDVVRACAVCRRRRPSRRLRRRRWRRQSRSTIMLLRCGRPALQLVPWQVSMTGERQSWSCWDACITSGGA
jgi:hypothetical protein